MLKAILKHGTIVPLEAVPPDWKEGALLTVENTNPTEPDIDEWAETMRRLCQNATMENQQIMMGVIEEQRAEAKAQACREMGISE